MLRRRSFTVVGMSQLSRRQKTDRAYGLVLTSGGAGVLAVVLAVLSIVGVVSFGFVVLAALIAVIAFVLFRKTVS